LVLDGHPSSVYDNASQSHYEMGGQFRMTMHFDPPALAPRGAGFPGFDMRAGRACSAFPTLRPTF